VQVDLGCFGLLVAEPERDDRGVDAGVEQLHRGGVPQGVGGDVLVGDRGAALGGLGGVEGDASFDGVAGESVAGVGRKQRLVAVALTFGQPDAKDSLPWMTSSPARQSRSSSRNAATSPAHIPSRSSINTTA
jgi:hypothetical protein